MLTKETFINSVGQRFWKHIHKETDLPHEGEKIPDRISELKKLWEKIVSVKYTPSPPRGYIVSHKQNLVVRFIPTLTVEDYCVYFYCIKSLEEEIAKNRVPGTFGGWRLGGKIRKLEEEDESIGVSFPDHSYNKFAWKQAWSDFQGKARNLYRYGDLQHFIIYDIANFYDSIRLDRLEKKIRELVNKDKSHDVALLFYFLSHWNKKYLYYEKQSVGLPQDEVGDCSRILANFYLQDYDLYLRKLAKKSSARYLRYVDDQIIATEDEASAKELMFKASEYLASIGLNLNASKAKFFSREEYNQYWSFDIFSLLENPNDIEAIERATALFKDRLMQGVLCKPVPVLKRLLNTGINKINPFVRKEILDMSLEPDFITNVNAFYLGKVYHFLTKSERIRFIERLNELSGVVLFNQFHLRVLNFAKKNKLPPKLFKGVQSTLQNLNNFQFGVYS